MSQPTVARRYAQALIEQAEAAGVTEKVDADVAVIRDAMEASRELVRLFESPIVSRDRKRAALRALLADRVEGITMRFVELLVEKRREALFLEIAASYGSLRDEEMGIVTVSVRSARPMDAGDEQDVRQRMEELTGKRVRLETSVDASLMGGLVVRVGDTVYDGSVQNRLEGLRDRLLHGSLPAN